MIKNLVFAPKFKALLPVTYAVLKSSNLVIHESVTSIILHGSRGIAGRARPTSDIDLSLIMDTMVLADQSDINTFLHEVSDITSSHWRSRVELDMAIVFDTRHCELKCFHQRLWNEKLCSQGGMDCFGLYKLQRGYNGFVTNAGVQVKLMYPSLEIWNNR